MRTAERPSPGMDPKNLRRWLILVASVYLVLPRDLVPDFFGRGLGLVDDAALVALLVWFYRKHQREYAARRASEGESRERAGGSPPAVPESSPDPYEVLGIPASASADEIQAAYKARMREYHPDKVAHLGEDLQKLAHRKAQEIQRANQKLRN